MNVIMVWELEGQASGLQKCMYDRQAGGVDRISPALPLVYWEHAQMPPPGRGSGTESREPGFLSILNLLTVRGEVG